ncbi:microcystin degradation protein MlrC [Parabacteroides sp. PF5-5]|uniref:M81 family metallopeptidase n=1 Tax=unclassified Parabacteroides TaxID=2649774 RepID=UPI002475F1FF|nr:MULTISPECIES: M81 family metallopeptidase [unclassified Parabacteroides]MDH6303927.1 microcystin degradation protein MlrC [Parabacteroides sp. PH5-39]MDH6314544.1 microcystin degradation protein MlrC [Parabacteroides sp. PF5-13]MDH6318391.1 microcystin degradation protein MlrC [Parabacteroides sp. PH5-13]MDH6322316.1 microcystin degradation protein MlrC [Parabacteroides sp. PH5-8]MDH6325604.1 microcystin degradation protein MlrC [Parabacteroides sp. PH5-41]
MKFRLLLLIPIYLIASISVSFAQKKPRVAIAGIAIECSTFSPARTAEEAFRKRTGEALLNSYPFLREGAPMREKAEWFPAMVASATPGGALTMETYESLTGQILELLKANAPYDALFFDIHGAMSVVGMDDPEGDFILKVREVVGKDALISTCMDLHGNVTERLAENTDLITCYRLAPHEDSMDSRERTVVNLIERLESGKGRPAYKAWVPVPILLPGEQTSTRVEPGKSLYASIDPATKQVGVIDAAIWIGYAWADEPRNHAVVMAYGDDKDMVVRTAEYLAHHFWSVRHQFEFVAPTATLEECLANAIASTKKPYFISDMGDNPTAGGAGDVTWTITELLKRPEFKSDKGKTLVYASIPGPEFVAKAIKAGVGNKVKGTAGAAVDNRYAPPVPLEGTVTSIYLDNPDNKEVVVKIGSIYVIVTEKRKGFHYVKEFTKHNIDLKQADIVVVKLGYLVPELYDIQADWMMALTLGGVNQDLPNLPYKRIRRPMFPLDKDMPMPNLKAKLIK